MNTVAGQLPSEEMYIARWLPQPSASGPSTSVPPYLAPDSLHLAFGATGGRAQASETDYKNTELWMKPDNGANTTNSNSNPKNRQANQTNSSGEQQPAEQNSTYRRKGAVVVATLTKNGYSRGSG